LITYELSALEAVSENVFNTFSGPSSIPSPNATKSTATLFFFNFLASLTMLDSSAAWPLSGDPTKTTILWRRFLFCRCFRASWATAIAVVMSASPPILSEVECTAWRICPSSFVCVTRTSGLVLIQIVRSVAAWRYREAETCPLPAIVMIPTVFSGFESIFVRKTVLTASACAPNLLGR